MLFGRYIKNCEVSHKASLAEQSRAPWQQQQDQLVLSCPVCREVISVQVNTIPINIPSSWKIFFTTSKCFVGSSKLCCFVATGGDERAAAEPQPRAGGARGAVARRRAAGRGAQGGHGRPLHQTEAPRRDHRPRARKK